MGNRTQRKPILQGIKPSPQKIEYKNIPKLPTLNNVKTRKEKIELTVQRFCQFCKETYVYQKAGETIPQVPGKTDPEMEYRALEDGFFKLCPVTQNDTVIEHTWLHFWKQDTFEYILKKELSTLNDKELEIAMIGVTSSRALQNMKKRPPKPSEDRNRSRSLAKLFFPGAKK